MMTRLLMVFVAGLAATKHEPIQKKDIVVVEVAPSSLYEGKTTRVRFWVEVLDGYHIQASRVEDESLIPTSLEVDGGESLTVARPKFPRAKKFKLEGTDTFLNVYDGKFPVTMFLRHSAGAPSGNYTLRARLRYQACDSRTCLFPRVIEFTIPVKVKTKDIG